MVLEPNWMYWFLASTKQRRRAIKEVYSSLVAMSLADIRKLRKKIRQIECLERLDRELTVDEEYKVERKAEFRSQLQELIAACSTELSTSVLDRCLLDDASDGLSLDSSAISAEDSDNSRDQLNMAVCEAATSSPQKHRLEQSSERATKTKKPASESDCVGSGTTTLPSSKRNVSNTNSPAGDAVKSVVADNAPLHSCTFTVRTLCGHHGPVTALSLADNILVTGSQDTTVKVWNVLTGVELRSFGGHSQTVTAVILLSDTDSELVVQGGDEDEAADLNKSLQNSSVQWDTAASGVEVWPPRIVLSASLDCTIRVWSLQAGSCLRSIYTFNPLTCLAFSFDVFVCGTDGGKLELWSPGGGSCPLSSILAHSSSVTDIAVGCQRIFTASADGLVGVFEWPESDKTLRRIFESCDVRTSNGDEICRRRIHGIALAADGTIFYGDDGMNVKVLDWKAGVVSKLANHTTDFGSTDAVCVADNLLITSGYDIDNGLGYVNVRSLPDRKYLYTLCDEQTSRISRVTCGRQRDGMFTLVTGGTELKVWSRVSRSGNNGSAEDTIRSVYVARFDKAARHSDVEPDSDSDECDSAVHETSLPWHHVVDEAPRRGYFSWCTLT